MMKDKIKSLIIVALAVMLTAGVAMAYSGSANIVVEGDMLYNGSEQAMGGFTQDKEYFAEGVVVGGAKTSLASTTLLARDFCDSSIIVYTPTATSTLTLPTAASIIAQCLSTVGDKMTVLLENGSTNAGMDTLTITAGTGMDMHEPTGNDVVMTSAEFAVITFWNYNGTTLLTNVEMLQDAD